MRTVLEDLHYPRRRVKVSRSGYGTFGTQWAVTFISHLEKWKPADVSIDTSLLTGTSARGNVTVEAMAAFYPVRYTLWKTGTFRMDVTVGQEKTHIAGSPFSILVDDGQVHPATSTSTGQGLVSGIAGDNFNFTVQAKDIRAMEIQTISTIAVSVTDVPEVQKVTCTTSNPFALTFRGMSTGNIAINADASTVQSSLQAITSISAVTV